MRFVATSDWQLGKAAIAFDEDARPRYQQSRFQAVVRIMDLAVERGADFVVVAGDVFESNQLDRRVLNRTFEALRGYEIPVYLLPGNHDPLDALSIYRSPQFVSGCPANVHVLSDSRPVGVLPNVEIVGAPWFSKRPLADLAEQAYEPLKPLAAGTQRILVAHGAVSTMSPDAQDPAMIDVARLERAIDEGKITAAMLGDRHGLCQVGPTIWYSGTPQVTAHREVDPGFVLVVEVDDHGGLNVEKVQVGDWEFLAVQRRLTASEDVDDLLLELGKIPGKDRVAIWLALSGELGPGPYARLEQGLEDLADVFAYLDHWDRHSDLVMVPDAADYAQLGLSGYAHRALLELTEVAADGGASSQDARGALNLLYRLAGGGK